MLKYRIIFNCINYITYSLYEIGSFPKKPIYIEYLYLIDNLLVVKSSFEIGIYESLKCLICFLLCDRTYFVDLIIKE